MLQTSDNLHKLTLIIIADKGYSNFTTSWDRGPARGRKKIEAFIAPCAREAYQKKPKYEAKKNNEEEIAFSIELVSDHKLEFTAVICIKTYLFFYRGTKGKDQTSTVAYMLAMDSWSY